ncbi:DUF4136 domain-containing protein [uncultured Pontibacter sp.]|uniref:DUF4136 domain-containing protein n=1 Tax=uncultured Pontibacter sp. TaxID=453356 RepID=UPI00260D5A81|nr:DUF4136 domain-containing protein [uncultured Pontibacter sp.]
MALLSHLPSSSFKQSVILLAILLCTGCTPTVNVQSLFDPTANFKVYQTFTWHPAEVPAPKQGSGGDLYSTLLDQRIKEAIASEMVKKGIKPSAESPGLLVAYDIAIDTPKDAPTANTIEPGFGYGYSYWYGYRFRYSGDGLDDFRSIGTYTPGSLVIDLIDPNTNQVVWRGAFDAEIDPVTIDVSKLNRAVASIMAQFPPVPSTVR